MANHDVKISIIVPVYNVREYLRECLDSLVKQDFDSYEVILVNDGSTDGSDLMCKEYADKYHYIRYFSQENKGQSAARNFGMCYATGEYILFVDSDDYVANDTCEVLYDNAKKYDADIIIGDILNEKSEIQKNPFFRYIPSENKRITTREYCEEAFSYGIYDIVPWIRLVRKSYLTENNIEFLEGCYYEDQEYSMRLFTTRNGTVVKIRFPFYYYRMDRPGSTTNYTSAKKGNDFIHVIGKMEENMLLISDDMHAAGLSILGLAYYHFSNLWVRIKYNQATEIQKEFCDILKKSQNSEKAIKCLDEKKQKSIKDVCKHPIKVKIKWKIKELIKKNVRR